MQLPSGLVLFRRDGTNSIEDASDLSLSPRRDFSAIVDSVGGDVTVALFDSEQEANAFTEGFQLAIPGDDTSYVVQRVTAEDGEAIAVVVHFGDSSDDNIRIIDKRASAENSEQSIGI